MGGCQLLPTHEAFLAPSSLPTTPPIVMTFLSEICQSQNTLFKALHLHYDRFYITYYLIHSHICIIILWVTFLLLTHLSRPVSTRLSFHNPPYLI